MKTNLILALVLTACSANVTTPDRPDAAVLMRAAPATQRPEPILLRPDQAALWGVFSGPTSPVLDCHSGSAQAYCRECGGQGGPCCQTLTCVIECDDYCKSRKTSCCAPL